MKLKGSCHCGAVSFRVTSHTPQPFMHCYCSICRKTAGGSGSAVNIMGRADTLEVQGFEHVRVYHARLGHGERGVKHQISPGARHFCGECGSALWISDPRWPELVHPFASAIDTALPTPPERVHIMEDFAAPWVQIPHGPHERHFSRYPKESIEAWHRHHGLYED